MKTTPVTGADLARSVIAVPPLAWTPDLRLAEAENRRLIKHIEAGGVQALLYGGNANIANLALGVYADLCGFLAEAAAADVWVLPSAGPDYGKLMDQARVLVHTRFPAVMILPSAPGAAAPEGLARAIRDFVQAAGRPAVLYIKNEVNLTPELAAALVDEGTARAIKYAIARPDPCAPTPDPYLERLLALVDRALVCSGMGEPPVIAHRRDFGVAGFTSGLACIAPRASMALLGAMRRGDWDQAARLHKRFLALEAQRARLGPGQALHDIVTASGVADMGAAHPVLANLAAETIAGLRPDIDALLAFENAAPEAA